MNPFRTGGPVTGYKNCVGPGWHGLLDQLDAELRAADPDYRTLQVKEKWGLLRVYIDGTPVQADIMGLEGVLNISIPDTATGSDWQRLQGIVDKYQRLSANICEDCGKPGTRTQTTWIRTLCAECAALSASRRKRIWAQRAAGEGGLPAEG